jgi:uncharacterized membrane protein YhaH (DUF805 family)
MEDNRYAAPAAAVADPDADPSAFQPVRFWSTTGRIGRLRLLAYLSASFFVITLAMVVVEVPAAAIGAHRYVPLVFWTPYAVVMFLSYVKRAHDLNWTGSLCILALVPLVNLVFFILPGTRGTNRFGAPPPPNPLAVRLLAWVFPALMVIGIVAAIAIPQLMRGGISANRPPALGH